MNAGANNRQEVGRKPGLDIVANAKPVLRSNAEQVLAACKALHDEQRDGPMCDFGIIHRAVMDTVAIPALRQLSEHCRAVHPRFQSWSPRYFKTLVADAVTTGVLADALPEDFPPLLTFLKAAAGEASQIEAMVHGTPFLAAVGSAAQEVAKGLKCGPAEALCQRWLLWLANQGEHPGAPQVALYEVHCRTCDQMEYRLWPKY